MQQDFVTTIMDPIYGTTGYTSLDTLHSHRLAVFFIIMATGCLFELHPAASMIADQYHALARAALSLDSLLQEVTCATVQTLFMVVRFIYSSDRTSNEERWILTGLCARIGQTVSFYLSTIHSFLITRPAAWPS